jgi:hypothetical protein
VALLALTLMAAALLAGAVAGAVVGWRRARSFGLVRAFLVYLGLLAVVSTTFSQAMEILPLALLYGVVTGILPFAAAFYGVRWMVSSYLAPRRRASAASQGRESTSVPAE